ncbi:MULTISPECIES: DUF2545 family protein [Edwardsiella]|uniref:Uncharacterized protein n=2 Tax=Edwardsiella anguillarum TaxID=1821960 RepID=A0A076LVK8_9GAMM|nr:MULTISPECIES: DUF2545 family protein [Edwardsiella]AIJ09554.1 Hypothetical protein ETEE_3125 [Edwardsiella anguillarum ET080813]AKR77325.1 DUF2545 family protein [Edwardsiella sp. LADL05-105]KAB0592534.1 cytochrome C [Edwardsiella anguillarum]UOU80346.1 DUF2545 family protein [Edwardsiella anguillarum]WHP85034.1 DUF2545 family protein [Edwardsiella anguillarum]
METLYGYLIGALVTLAICAFAWARRGWRGGALAFVLQVTLACGFYYGAWLLSQGNTVTAALAALLSPLSVLLIIINTNAATPPDA